MSLSPVGVTILVLLILVVAAPEVIILPLAIVGAAIEIVWRILTGTLKKP